MFTLEHFIKPTIVAGLEVNFNSEGDVLFQLTVVRLKGKGLKLVHKVNNIETWERVKKEFKPRIPIALSLTGKGVLHKKISSVKSGLEAMLPNAKEEDFYLQRTPAGISEEYLSIVRKELADKIFKLILGDGYSIVDVTLGPLVMNNLIPFLHANRESIVLGEYRVEIENDLIKMFEKTETSFQNRKQIIAGEELQAASVLSFSSAFRFLFTQQTPPFIEIEQVKFHSGEHTQKELFKVLGWGVMLFFLSVLLVNFLVFDHYHTKGNNLEARYSQNKEFLDYIGQMKMKLAGKKAFVEQSGLQFSTQTSFYADRIAKDLPENIQLSEISINPLAKKIKTGEPIVFQQKNIKVKGHCVKSAYLNDWMHVLKKYEWIKDVAVINYKQDLAAEPGEFEINIQIN